ncbi:hypothetical protein Leryth_025774 [Lithospermum erythrorhizon]|nr:hypothetical protein Leryth_025774 [Lithospermum erythrorhizon]
MWVHKGYGVQLTLTSSPTLQVGGGDLKVKKKRGRPTKYDEDGNLRAQYMTSFSLSSPSGELFSSTKRGRGRPIASSNFHTFASMGEVLANTAGSDFLPHVVTVHTGEDVAGKLLSIAQKGPRGICILSANGTVSNVTIRQPGSSGGLLTYEGRFEILTLTGSFTPSENNGMKSRTGGLSISLAGPDGHVVGGGVAGGLLAANPIQVVFGSFMPNSYKLHKRKYHVEPRMAPVVNNAPNIVREAMPVSQAAPASKISPLQIAPFSVQSHGEVNNSIINERENLNSTSTGSADYNNPGPTFDHRNYPDINVSISFD